MKFSAGIIAAGEGSRLAVRDPKTIKPLFPVGGRPLSHWIVDSLRSAGATDLTVLTNSRGAGVPPSLSGAFPTFRFDFLTADTASSYESFRLVSRHLAAQTDGFIISTVDAIIAPDDIAGFWDACRRADAIAGLALTEFVDDENPLWADVNGGMVTAVGDDARERRQVTCGLYYMTRDAARALPEPSSHPRLRDFWRTLIASGAPVVGTTLSKTLDIDRPEDVDAAQAHLASIGVVIK